ncbi:MAG: hypothetical protein B7733_06130 [Myxococcales bacterium FL481]|nr:MAG: hypothetical protein B7733_06130 [Myxococcales bacterium FL481]
MSNTPKAAHELKKAVELIEREDAPRLGDSLLFVMEYEAIHDVPIAGLIAAVHTAAPNQMLAKTKGGLLLFALVAHTTMRRGYHVIARPIGDESSFEARALMEAETGQRYLAAVETSKYELWHLLEELM